MYQVFLRVSFVSFVLLVAVSLSPVQSAVLNQDSTVSHEICKRNCGTCYVNDHFDIPEPPLATYNRDRNPFLDIVFPSDAENSQSKSPRNYFPGVKYGIAAVGSLLTRNIAYLYCQPPTIYTFYEPLHIKEYKYSTKTRPVLYSLEAAYYFVDWDSKKKNVLTVKAVRGTFDLHCSVDAFAKGTAVYSTYNVSSVEVNTDIFLEKASNDPNVVFYCLFVSLNTQSHSCVHCREKDSINTARVVVVPMAGRLAGQEFKDKSKKEEVKNWVLNVTQSIPWWLESDPLETYFVRTRKQFEDSL